MKKKFNVRKLQVSRQTVRALRTEVLQEVGGGGTILLPSWTCTGDGSNNSCGGGTCKAQ